MLRILIQLIQHSMDSLTLENLTLLSFRLKLRSSWLPLSIQNAGCALDSGGVATEPHSTSHWHNKLRVKRKSTHQQHARLVGHALESCRSHRR